MSKFFRIAELIDKRLKGTSSIEEDAELDDWGRETPKNQELLDNYARPEARAAQRHLAWQVNEITLLRRMGTIPPPPGLLQRMQENGQLRLLKKCAAAALIVTLGIGIYKGFNKKTILGVDWQQSLLELQAMPKTITRPTLTMNNTILDLDSAREGQIGQFGIWKLVKQSADHFAFLRIYPGGLNRPDSMKIVISLPPGKKYTFLLSDKSKCELYPGSSGSFKLFLYDTVPRNRKFTLLGTAAFDVHKAGGNPFRVETNNGEFTVLSTSFIIKDSNDAARITQLSGSTEVRNSRKMATLTADHEASFSLKSPEIQPVEVAMKIDSGLQQSDLFIFAHVTLPQAMEEIRKNYGMTEVSYEAGIDTTSIGKAGWGNLTRDLPLRKLLDFLTTKDMYFIIQGTKITVKHHP